MCFRKRSGAIERATACAVMQRAVSKRVMIIFVCVNISDSVSLSVCTDISLLLVAKAALLLWLRLMAVYGVRVPIDYDAVDCCNCFWPLLV